MICFSFWSLCVSYAYFGGNVFFFKQKTAYEMRISDWSSDVCSSDLKHINGEGDGGMLNTMKPLSLKGNGILGKKLTYVTGDTQTKSDAARASARRMIEKDGVILFTGGSSSGVAVACHDRKSVV